MHLILVEFSSVIIRVHYAPNINEMHLTRVELSSVIIHLKRSFAEDPRHQRKFIIMADRTKPLDRSAPWYQDATSAKFIGMPVNVNEKLNPIHFNIYANEWASADEPGLYGKALLEDFQKTFHGWDPGVFNLFNKTIRGYVRARLRINGIYINSGSTYPLKQAFADLLDLKEPPTWPKNELRNAILNLKGFICSQKTRFTAEKIANNPELNSSSFFNTRYPQFPSRSSISRAASLQFIIQKQQPQFRTQQPQQERFRQPSYTAPYTQPQQQPEHIASYTHTQQATQEAYQQAPQKPPQQPP
jgi:hypothetical protein